MREIKEEENHLVNMILLKQFCILCRGMFIICFQTVILFELCRSIDKYAHDRKNFIEK